MNYERIVRQYFEIDRTRSTDTEIAFRCPEPNCHDKSANRSVNVRNGKTNCWRCGVGGDFIKWAKKLGYVFDEEDVAPAPQTLDLDKDLKSESLTVAHFSDISLPPGFTPLKLDDTHFYARRIAKMAKRKHLEYADMVEYGVGYTAAKTPWERFAIFPVKEWGKVVYFQGRTYTDVPGQSTKKFPKKQTECPLGMRHWVYGIDEARKERRPVLILVESILNVISLNKELRKRGVKAVPLCIFRHHVSKEQMVKIKALKPLEICMMFDPDAIGDSLKYSARFNCPVTLVNLPPKVDANDNAELAVDLYLKRKKVETTDRLLYALGS